MKEALYNIFSFFLNFFNKLVKIVNSQLMSYQLVFNLQQLRKVGQWIIQGEGVW